MTTPSCYLLAAALAALVSSAAVPEAQAARIGNKVAVFAALDKVTARISELEVPVDETVEFGSLTVTPRVCYSRPPTEQPKTTTFVEIEQIELDDTKTRLFTGWMLAESPGLNALEHPVFDVWLTGCKDPVEQPATAASANPGDEGLEGLPTAAPPQAATPFPRRRIRR